MPRLHLWTARMRTFSASSHCDRTAGAILSYVARYVHDPVLARELESGQHRVEYLKNDRNLNGTLASG